MEGELRLGLNILAVAFLVVGSVNAAAEKRVALVIGNSAYEYAPELANPSNDAADVAAKLEDLNFELVMRLDASLPDMLSAVEEFSDKLREADLALFYYAGHGLQVDGRNYLVPVNAKLESHFRLDYEAVPVNMVMAAMQRRSKTNLLFLDACRNNPMARSLARSLGTRSSIIGRGLARIGAGRGTFVSFATEPGNVALDGEGENSPYTEALVRHLGAPGEGLAETMVLVRKDVIESTDGKQVPWEHSSLTGRVVLQEKEAEPVAARPSSNDQFEITFWNSIKDAKSIPYFDTYLNQFPQGRFAALAKLKIADLQRLEHEQSKAGDAVEPESRAALEAESQQQVKGSADVAVESKPEEKNVVAALPIEKPEPVIKEKPQVDPKTNRTFVRSLQRELNRLGCSVGTADGIWGKKTEQGLDSFGRHGEVASLNLNAKLLDALKARKARVCPLVCGRNQEERNGRCVDNAQFASQTPQNSEGDRTQSQQLSECVRIAVNVPRTKPNGSNWDPEGENNRIAPDIFITDVSTWRSSQVCNNSYSCSWVIRNASSPLKLSVTDKDRIQHDLIGRGSCSLSSGKCSLGVVSARLSGC